MSAIPERYYGTTKKAMAAAAGCGPLGAITYVGDVAAIAGIWGTFLYSVARAEHMEMDKGAAVQIGKTVLLGVAGYYAGCKMATRLLNLLPGAGTLVGMGVSSLANILFTYRFALTVCTVFFEHRTSGKAGQIAVEILSAFRGNGTIRDVKDIVALWDAA